MRARVLLLALVAGLVVGCQGNEPDHRPKMGTDIQAPAPVVFGPTVSFIRATSVAFDLVNKRYTIVYLDPATGMSKTITGATPNGVQTSLDNHVTASIQAAEGWEAGADVLVP